MVKFSKPGYRVDALKVEVPVNMAFVAGSPGWKRNSLHSRIGDGLLSAAEDARVPFIYLSQGVRTRRFSMRWSWRRKPGLISRGCFADGPQGKTALRFLSNTA
jgi:tagatose 1,6-diphosphate aldolase